MKDVVHLIRSECDLGYDLWCECETRFTTQAAMGGEYANLGDVTCLDCLTAVAAYGDKAFCGYITLLLARMQP